MRRRYLVAYLGVAMAWAAILPGCTGHRELIGEWTIVNSSEAPAPLRQMKFSDEHHMQLADGESCEYTAVSDGLVKITYPDGKSYDYGFSRSGEYLTLVDNGKKIPYTLVQG